MLFSSLKDIEAAIADMIKKELKHKIKLENINSVYIKPIFGRITIKGQKEYIEVNFSNCCFMNNQHIEDNTIHKENECVVCYEPTTNITKCKHYLCSSCINKISKNDRDIKCPYCREKQKVNGYIVKIPMKAAKMLFS